MSHHINEGDEEAFVENAEMMIQNLQVRVASTSYHFFCLRVHHIIASHHHTIAVITLTTLFSLLVYLQRLAKGKLQLQYTPVIDACMKIEDMIYVEALKDVSLPHTANLWQHRRAIDAYLDLCDTVTRNLESLVRKDWQSKFQESPPLALFRLLTGRSSIAIRHADFDASDGGGRKRGRDGRNKDGDFDHLWGKSTRGKNKKALNQKSKEKRLPKSSVVSGGQPGIAPGAGISNGSHGGHAPGGVFFVEKFQPGTNLL